MTAASVDTLCVRLRARLRAEQLGPGERLGDERSLAEQLGVPRAQLRSALDRLEAEGLVRRTIGRGGGVRVADGRIERNLNTIEGLPDIARYQGFHVDTRVLRVELTTAGARERRLLQLPEGAAVHRLWRLRLADGRPLSLEESHLPADLFPGLATQDLGSLYRTLRTVYGVEPEYSDESLELTFADHEQAAHLGVDVGSPLVHVQRTATGTGGRPIEAAHEHFVGTRMRFHLRKYGYVTAQHEHQNRHEDQHQHPRRTS
ncbi:GntR family transcriptional regulator [Cellulomonas soli]|uniref:GntR family transcriptional regulator n=1 Tax=Cellulomonas soli TaxID=931535 RepID=UPI003F86F3F6